MSQYLESYNGKENPVLLNYYEYLEEIVAAPV
jgi:hypothetical protein